MKVLVYPHDLGMGGSQLNAVELAGAVRDLGHDVVVYGRPGVLNGRIDELGLEFVEGCEPGRRPSLGVARQLRRVVDQHDIQVVHGYEWPPILEARLAVAGSRVAVTGTVMSMAVAPFIPRDLPLVVGTPQIAAHEQRLGRRGLTVIEPPVDVILNAPDAAVNVREFEHAYSVPSGLRVVVVSRLAHELKLEGLLSAVEVVPTIADDAVLVLVGGGPAQGTIQDAALAANRRAGRRAVVVTGEVADPRAAYASADITLGMGGSALRAMAFAKPLVVQGERGFWSTLTPESFEAFAWTGWYGVGDDVADGPERLRAELAPLAADPALRHELGRYSRHTVVDRFSLRAAAVRQEAAYDAAGRAATPRMPGRADLRAVADLARYKANRVASRVMRRHRMDDFNAAPVALTARSAGAAGTAGVRRASGAAVEPVGEPR